MDSKPIVGRIFFNSALPAFLAVAILFTGCAPVIIKAPKTEAVTSTPAAPAPEAAAPAPAAAPAAPLAPEENPLSRTWQRLMSLESKSDNIGFITISNVVTEKSQGASLAPGVRRIEAGMDIAGQLRKPFVEAVMHFDASPARIAGIDTSDVSEIKPEDVIVTTFLSKGRAGWRMQPADGQVPLVSQKLRLYIEVPQGVGSVELRVKRSFKKANGDTFNNNAPTQDNREAQRLLDVIHKELIRRANGAGSDIPWMGVEDCASVKGENKKGQCYPTDASWRLAEKRAAGLGSIPWQEKITLRVSGGAAASNKEEPVKPQPAAEAAEPVEAPKPVEAAEPAVAPKPVEAAEPVEYPKPAEAAKPVESPKPAEAAKPVEAPKPAGAAKPVVAPKPAGAAKPAATPKPAAAAKTQPEPAKKPATSKVEPKKKVNESGQPIYDLSDVLGKQ